MIKQVIFGLLTATISLGAVAPAFAKVRSEVTTEGYEDQQKTYSQCEGIDYENWDDATHMLHYCGKWIVGESKIGFGNDKDSVWKDIYPNIEFASATKSSDEVTLERHQIWYGFIPKHKYIWKIEGHEALRTKEIAPGDLKGALSAGGLKINSDNQVVKK